MGQYFCGVGRVHSIFELDWLNHTRLNISDPWSNIQNLQIIWKLQILSGTLFIIDVICGEILYESEGTISPSKVNGMYLPNMMCRWEIMVPVNDVILLASTSFAVEHSTGCTWDVIYEVLFVTCLPKKVMLQKKIVSSLFKTDFQSLNSFKNLKILFWSFRRFKYSKLSSDPCFWFHC